MPLFLILAAVVFGVWRAAALAWTSDDAYISFRYARNWVEGLGLVYNPGERVEGYTNFLWTAWCAVGIALGVAIERWADVSSIVCWGATIALLGFAWTRRRARGSTAAVGALPLAAWLLAVHRDAAVFATSGLETALFGLLGVVGWIALAEFGRPAGADGASAEAVVEGTLAPSPRRAALAGMAFALATLTRPDGALWVAAAFSFVLLRGRPRIAASAGFAVAALVVLLPFASWKIAYYGDVLPNTYYAKSAARSWIDQGLVYAGLYFRQYWVLALALPLGAIAWARRGGATRDRVALALALALPYVAYVVKVGGDFMYARLLVPTVPFLALALEAALPAVAPRRAVFVAAAVLVFALALMPKPFEGEGWVRGIVDEWVFYRGAHREQARDAAVRLGRLAEGLPLRVVITGQQAIIAYHSRVSVAIEASAGLTDAWIARLPLAKRGRPGHEKEAPLSYLIDRRRAHLYLGRSRILADSLLPYVPLVTLDYGPLRASVLTWDPPVIAEMRERGAEITGFDEELDRFVGEIDRIPEPVVAEVYAKAKRFYFAGVTDSTREAPFRRRLGLDR